ncbi:MAG: PAS domain-containing protein, partial [Desulfobulbaceae bacterium]|nr:PAS domain-containing protein [Desulfobulbaceae bacterium]
RKEELSRKVIGTEDVYRREITQELLSTKNHFEITLCNISEGFLELSADHRIIYANQAAAVMFDSKEEELLATTFADHFRADHRRQILDLFRNLEGEASLGEQSPLLLNNRHILIHVLPVIDQAERSLIVIIHDITQRKQAEQELTRHRDALEELVRERTAELMQANEALQEQIARRAESEEATILAYNELRQIFDACSDSMRVMDTDGRIIRVNKSFAELAGISPDEARGKHCSALFSCPNCHTERCSIRRIVHHGQPVESEATHTGRDGATAFYLITTAPMRDPAGRLIGVVQNLKDITLRKLAEGEIRKAKEDWERTFESIGDIATIQDKEMRIVRVNQATCRALGAPPAELVGKRCHELFHGTGEPCPDCPALLTIIDGMARSAEIFHPTLDRTFLVSASPVFDDKGTVMGIAHFAKDLSETKKLEQRLRQAHKMEAIGTLAGGIAHDFNNILTAILGYTELAMASTDKENKLHQDLQAIKHAGRRAGALVRQILSFSRQDEQQRRTILVAPLVKEALKMMRATLPSTIDIQTEITAEQAVIDGNPTQIHQVLMNLCTNGAHALRPHGGILRVSLTTVTIADGSGQEEGAALPPGTYLKLSVADNGQGIPPEILNRIFEPYFTTKEQGKGTGLGLAMAHGIVLSHGGRITVESEVDKGTTVNVFFPVITDPTMIEPVQIFPPAQGNERILLVDDEPMVLAVARRLLQSLGYEVVGETDSTEALALFRTRADDFDLVITDMTMPKLTGAQLAEQMLALRPDLPIILCTGFNETINKEMARNLGIKGYALKPFTTEEMAHLIRQVLDGPPGDAPP